MKEYFRKLLPESADLTLTRVMRSWRAARERRHYRSADLCCELPSGLEAKVKSRAEWMAFNDIFVRGIYDNAINAALASAEVSCACNVLDLGANVGYFALRFLDLTTERYGQEMRVQLHLVEASPSVCAELKERVLRQVPHNVLITITNGLAGARTGRAALYESAYHIGNSLACDRYAHKAIVSYVDLEQLTASVKTIDLLKCDIEGAEEAFLENYPQLLDKVRVGAIELHHGLCDTRYCRQLLAECGFHIWVTRATESFEELWFERKGSTVLEIPDGFKER